MVGMRSMDVPDRGQGRSPAELLDNLRLRLSQLADNHPSAPRRGETGHGPGEPPLRDGADAVQEGGEPARPDAMPESGELGQPEVVPEAGDGSGRGAPGGDGPGGDGPGGDGPGGPAARGGPGDLNLPGLRGGSEAYRPWFMSGEPGAPWWAAGEDL